MKIQISNKSILFAQSVLGKLVLDLKSSMARRRFLKTIAVLVDDYNAELNDLRYTLCMKTGDKPNIINNEFQFTVENRKQFNRKFYEILELVVDIDLGESGQKDIETILIILKSEEDKTKEKNKTEYSSFDFEYLSSLQDLSEQLLLKK